MPTRIGLYEDPSITPRRNAEIRDTLRRRASRNPEEEEFQAMEQAATRAAGAVALQQAPFLEQLRQQQADEAAQAEEEAR